MQLTRRGFLGSILALAAAPAIVRADSLMRVVPRDTGVLLLNGGALVETVDFDEPLTVSDGEFTHLEYRVMYDFHSGRPTLRAYDRIEKIHANVEIRGARPLCNGGQFLSPAEVCKIDLATREEAQRLIDECKAARKGWSPRKA